MILDSEPKPLASDIEIRIPSKAQAVTINGSASTGVNGTVQGTIQAAVPALGAALDPSEQIINTSPPLPSIVMPATDVKPAPAPMPLPVPVPVPKAEAPVRPAESRPEPYFEPKPVAKAEPAPESKPTPKAVDSTRALAILEGRPVAKEASRFNYVVQVAALATQDKVDELQERLKAAGIDSYTQKISTSAGQRIRIRVGPFGSREEADKALAKLARLGLNGSLVPT
jgi:DedD protein